MGAVAEPCDLFVGLISGTSMDGIDAALVAFGERRCKILATLGYDYPDELRGRLKRAITEPGNVGVDEFGALDHLTGRCFGDAAAALLSQAEVAAHRVTAIGCHGQTLRHLPHSPHPFTLQIGDPNLVVAATGITTVADFRRADVALGGEGAPLTPAFHQWLFGGAGRVVLNIGGIANITVLAEDDVGVVGFDTGPGNTLMDAWIREVSGKPFDRRGGLASQGNVSEELLAALSRDAYFSLPPPKSTGFEYFNLGWLRSTCAELTSLPPADVQATLAELTAQTIADAIRDHGQDTHEVLACGGGVHNEHLMNRITRALPDIAVRSTEARGLHPDWVEAAAFAWLAKRRLEGLPGNLPSVTGASRATVLGAIYVSTS